MLKIKDNVDLKELENFKFKFTDNGYERFCGNGNFLRIVDYWEYNKIIYIYKNWIMGKKFEKLSDESLVSDLISAGLVEKVEE